MTVRDLSLTLLFCVNFSFSGLVQAAEHNFDYQLAGVEIARNTYIFEGRTEDFSVHNGGNIVNTAFIVTEKGVIVIDSGVSRRYGEQQRRAIASITDKPILGVYLTHHHPDHFLGNQAYADSSIYALDETVKSIKVEGENFRTNMYRLVGDWMRGTLITFPNNTVKAGKQKIGSHELEFFSLSGHTSSDLVIFDHSTGVLFTGDLVFHQRTATTPHANVEKWQQTLSELRQLPFKVLVPGHGPISTDVAAIDQTSDYLAWLVNTLQQGAGNGLDMNEVMRSPIPPRFQSLALVRQELIRSGTHLYPAIENQFLKPVNE